MSHRINRRVRFVFVAVLALATLPGLSASTAIAATVPTDSDCKPASAGSSARGARREPVLKRRATEVARSAKTGPRFGATIPVYFHVVYAGNVGNVTNKNIDDQIAVLNKTFGGGEGGPNTGFTFRLVGVDRTKNKTFFNAGPETAQERAMKTKLHKGGRSTLNLYSTSGAGFLGWAYFPDLPDNELYLDGVVMDWKSMLGTSTAYAGQYDQGETATHEVGHWLNLYHVFEGCTGPGDYVADTPAQSTPSSGCPVGQDSCPNKPGLDSVRNYMDYSYDTCYIKFTLGQAQRMQDAWEALRANG